MLSEDAADLELFEKRRREPVALGLRKIGGRRITRLKAAALTPRS